MAKVTTTRNLIHDGRHYDKGSSIEVADDQVEALVKGKLVEAEKPAEQPKTEKPVKQ